MRRIMLGIAASLTICMSLEAVAASKTKSTCEAISPEVLDTYSIAISKAVGAASMDAKKNGTKGRYAEAANKSRDLFLKAQNDAKAGAEFLRKSKPEVTSYAEAGVVKDKIRSILETIPQAAHWATISAVHHKSTDARDAFEQGVELLNRGSELFSDASQCYMAAYLNR